jgi:DNA replication protein DnaC
MKTPSGKPFSPWLADIRAMLLARQEAIASQPCSTCSIDSPTAAGCKFRGEAGCKHQSEFEQRKADEVTRRARAARLRRAGVKGVEAEPLVERIVWGSEFLDETTALKTVREVLAVQHVRWCVLSGRPGCGKSTAGRFALAEWEGLFVTAGDLCRARDFDALGSIDDARGARLLVVDDLAEAPTSIFGASQLEEVLTTREVAPLLTVITTNLTAAQFKATHGARLVSRVFGEAGVFRTCPEGDLRQRSKSGKQ